MIKDNPQPSWTDRIPSILWIPIIIGGGVLLIGGIFAFFIGLATVEGFASIMLLVVAWALLRANSPHPEATPAARGKSDSLLVAFGISFFALMGFAIDQTGNIFYNQPVEWLFCPDGTQMTRDEDVSHPRAGETQITQEFACINSDNTVVEEISLLKVMGVRFVEYVFIGYALVYLSRLYDWVRRRRVQASYS